MKEVQAVNMLLPRQRFFFLSLGADDNWDP